MGGALGLDWPQAESVMRQMRVARAEWPVVSEALSVIAAEVLKAAG